MLSNTGSRIDFHKLVERNGSGERGAKCSILYRHFQNMAQSSHQEESENTERYKTLLINTASTSKERGEGIVQLSEDIITGTRKRKRFLNGAVFDAEAHAQQKRSLAEMTGPLLSDGRANRVSIPRGVAASMEACFASLTSLPPFQDSGNVSMRTNEDMKFAMQTLRAFVSKRFCELIREGSEFEEHIQSNVLPFLSDYKIPEGIAIMVNKLLISFTQWSQDYEDADTNLKKTTCDLLKLAELEEEFVDVFDESGKAISAEKEMQRQLVIMECRKQELEEQLKAVQDKIAYLSSSCETAATQRGSLVDKGKSLQTEKDNFRVPFPRIMAERASAKLTQEIIGAECFKLGEVFNEILMSEFGSV